MRTLCILILAALPAAAWNEVGHRAIAGLAYDHLTPAARRHVDDLVRNHPDYGTLFTDGAPTDPAQRARYAFMRAAYWPDTLRGDPRFYDDTRKDAQPTPALPGFPDMKRHTNWHYIDIGFSTDGTPVEPTPEPNALTQIRWMIDKMAAHQEESYLLPWLLHLTGDLHQPLHCVARFKKGQEHGDLGGNLVILAQYRNLHSFWDGALGEDRSPESVEALISELAKIKNEPNLAADPAKWVDEGYKVARVDVYSFTDAAEVTLTPAYIENAHRVARQRAAAAAERLAELLNRLFQ